MQFKRLDMKVCRSGLRQPRELHLKGTYARRPIILYVLALSKCLTARSDYWHRAQQLRPEISFTWAGWPTTPLRMEKRGKKS